MAKAEDGFFSYDQIDIDFFRLTDSIVGYDDIPSIPQFILDSGFVQSTVENLTVQGEVP